VKDWLAKNKALWMVPLIWLLVLGALMLYQAVAAEDAPFTYFLF